MALGDIAARMPWPVFACAADKKPVVATGFKAASRDAPTILKQFSHPSAALIGMPTGKASGIVVIDIDIKNGQNGQAWLDENAKALPQTRTHKTRSGGLHLLFINPHAVEVRNSASRVAPGVDVRGEGGYVILPPSPGYAIADDHEPAEMPRWLLRACMPPEAAATVQRPQERHEKYVQSAIDGEIATVIRAAEGTRNDTLHKAAVKLGTLVGAGQIARGVAEAELQRAGQMCGLSARECAATIKSGLDFGVTQPREMPERRNGHAPFVDLPPPDETDPGWWESLERDFQSNQAHAEPAEVVEPASPEPPQIDSGGIIDPRDWTAPAPLRQWLVPDWIPIGYVTGIYGDGGLGKSLLAQQLLTSTALSLPWLGMAVRGGFAFGMMCEDDTDELHRRQSGINAAYGVEMQHLELLRYSSRIGLDNLLMTFDFDGRGKPTPLYAGLVKYLTEHRPRLVAIDTLADTFGGDEIKRTHARQFIQGIGGNLARAFECAVVICAHPSASGISSGSGTGGSTAWSNTFRSRLYLTKPSSKDGETDDPDARLLSRMKANYAPSSAEMKLRWEGGCFVRDGIGPQSKGIQWTEIDAIFDEIDRAWNAGEPWSTEPQTRRVGRYLPTWMQVTQGIAEREAGRLLNQWLAGKYIRMDVFDAKAKSRGLRVCRRISP